MVLTAALVTLVALPGVAGSQTPSTVRPLTAEAFQKVRLPASDGGWPLAIHQLDAGDESAGHLDDTGPLIERGQYAPPTRRPAVLLPASVLQALNGGAVHGAGGSVTTASVERRGTAAKRKAVSNGPARLTTAKPSTTTVPRPTTGYKRVLSGLASWYDNGTTAMRLPRGTRIRICGARTCVSRIVRDWGPARYLSNRVVDMTPGDFVLVTGRHLGAGLAPVKVYIY